jgi:hypothetical protein
MFPAFKLKKASAKLYEACTLRVQFESAFVVQKKMQTTAAFFFVCLAVCVSAITVQELQCDTDPFVLGVRLPDDDLRSLIGERVAPFLFRLNTTADRELYYIRFKNETFQVLSYTVDNLFATGPKNWTFVLPAVVAGPGELVACVDVPGCDGIDLDMVLFLRLFPTNATRFVISFQLEYLLNATGAPHVLHSVSGTHRRLLTLGKVFQTAGRDRNRVAAVAPSTATAIGDSDSVIVEFNATQALIDEAFPAAAPASDSTLSTAAIIGISVAAGVVALCLVGCLVWTSRQNNPAVTAPSEMARLAPSEMTPAASTAGSYGHHYGRSHDDDDNIAPDPWSLKVQEEAKRARGFDYGY